MIGKKHKHRPKDHNTGSIQPGGHSAVWQLLVDCFEKETQRSASVSSLILEAAATELL